MNETLQWSTKARRMLLPRRMAEAQAPKFSQRSVAKALATVFETQRPRWNAGLRCSEGAARQLLSAVIASSSEDKLSEVSGAELQVEVEAARAAVLGLNHHVPWLAPKVGDQLVAFWRGVAGLSFAVEALARSWVYLPQFPKSGRRPDGKWTPGTATALALSDNTPNLRGVGLRNGLVGPWIGLRSQIASSSDDAYEAARAAAERLRANTGDEVRYALAFAFPSEPHWALDDAKRWMVAQEASEYPDHAGHCLLASLGDPQTVERLVRLVSEVPKGRLEQWKLWVRYLYTVVERLGPSVADMLITLVETTSTAKHRRDLAGAVAVIQSERVIEWMKGQTEGTLRLIAGPYLQSVADEEAVRGS